MLFKQFSIETKKKILIKQSKVGSPYTQLIFSEDQPTYGVERGFCQ